MMARDLRSFLPTTREEMSARGWDALDILLVPGTLVWAIVAIYPHARWISYVQIPYLLWVSFAAVLQLTITFLNR